MDQLRQKWNKNCNKLLLDYKLELTKCDTDSTGFVGLEVCALETYDLQVSLHDVIGGNSTKINTVRIGKLLVLRVDIGFLMEHILPKKKNFLPRIMNSKCASLYSFVSSHLSTGDIQTKCLEMKLVFSKLHISAFIFASQI